MIAYIVAKCDVCKKRDAEVSKVSKRGVRRYYCERHDPDRVIDDYRFTPGGSPIFF